MKKFSFWDWFATLLAAIFITWPLFLGVYGPKPIAEPITAKTKDYVGEHIWNWIHRPNFTDWLLVIIGAGQLVVFNRQATIGDRQRILMEGQLKATQTAANAALASLNRPWLFIENPTANYLDWLEGTAQLQASFRIANHGNAPAIILAVSSVFFLGEDYHNGTPENMRPNGFIEFPNAEHFGSFIFNHARSPATENVVHGHTRLFFLPKTIALVLAGNGTSTEKLTLPGPGRIQHTGPGIALEMACSIYFLGVIYYRLPSQGVESMTFCFRLNNGSDFQIFKDHPPYNEHNSQTHLN